MRGYHPLLATLAATGEVLHARLRSGSARSSQGVVRFVAEVVARLRRAGVDGPVVVRADAGFYLLTLLSTFSRLGVGFTVTAHMRPPVRRAIKGIDERSSAIPGLRQFHDEEMTVSRCPRVSADPQNRPANE